MKRILALVDHVYEDLELWYPKDPHRRSGLGGGPGRDRKRALRMPANTAIPADLTAPFPRCRPRISTALLLPGGFAPDKLRRDPHVLQLTRTFHASEKLIAFHLSLRLDSHLGRYSQGP